MAKGYYPNWSEEVLVIKKVKSAVPWTYVISDLKGEKVVRTFQEKKKEKTNKKEFRAEKVLNKELCVKWKDYDDSFNSWIDKRDMVYMSEYFPKPK